MATAWLPAATIAFRFLLPMMAPMPPRPAARSRSFMMAANSTRFSPAGPMQATEALAAVCSCTAFWVCCVFSPHRAEASRTSTVPSWT